MLLNSAHADPENQRNFAISLAFRQPVQDFSLPRRQRLLCTQLKILRAALQHPLEVWLEEFQEQHFFIGEFLSRLRVKPNELPGK